MFAAPALDSAATGCYDDMSQVRASWRRTRAQPHTAGPHAHAPLTEEEEWQWLITAHRTARPPSNS